MAALPCVIDIEASGFGRASYPIEIGFVREDGHAWCALVLPADDWQHWDPQAEQLHHISPAMLQDHGRPVREVAAELNQALAGRIVYCDGWAHDYAWLNTLFESAQQTMRFKLESVRRLLDESQLAHLDQLRRNGFSVLGITRHRASSDARALQWALGQLVGAESAEAMPLAPAPQPPT